jgi:(1->4)-alpha-D-glucan 1-alpha-D-glucosylmutase
MFRPARQEMTRALTATYRLQLRREFPLAAARDLVPYFHRLGISHLYLSPVLAARPGSPHGYDVIDHSRLNPELGTEDDLRSLARELHGREMGIILDIVPNHMAASETNHYWDDVLARGRSSRYVDWFDVDWDAPHARGRVVLPVLGDELSAVLDRGEIKLRIRDSGARLDYQGRTLPLDPSTLPKELQLAQLDPAGRGAAEEWAIGEQGKGRLRALLGKQHYELVFWRQASRINYRRFFDVNDLVALRMESDAVFEATHALILAWGRDGIVDGLRIDHVDGLTSPSWYLTKLRQSVPATILLFVEKILAEHETLPADWPVNGTTGYEFMNDVEELFLDSAGFAAIEANYRGLRRNPTLSFSAVAADAKRRVLKGPLAPDVQRVARLLHTWRPVSPPSAMADAITSLAVHLDVYRTYVTEPGVLTATDRESLSRAFDAARRSEPGEPAAVDALFDAFVTAPTPGDHLRTEIVRRFQQLSPPALAKGVEDTALYVYMPLASRNEVGGKPDRALDRAAERFHARNEARRAHWPHALLAVNTHDTKRSADLRARLDALTWQPDAWARHSARWRRLNKPRKRIVRGKPAPDTNSEYLFYQMLLGLWPAQRPERRADDLPDPLWIERACDRLVAYMLKAAREAKTRTSWTDADSHYEKALEAFVRETMQTSPENHFLPDVARLTALAADAGFRLSLARVLIQCTVPGTPDVYQGDEVWNFTLVDPDNRRPVDFQQLQRWVADAERQAPFAPVDAPQHFEDPRIKLAVLARLLRFRRDHAQLFAEGGYFPLSSGDVFAFLRRRDHDACLVVARTHLAKEPGPSAVEPLRLPDELVGTWRSILSGRSLELARASAHLTAPVNELIERGTPCELWHRIG